MDYDTLFFQRRLEHRLVMAGDGSITQAERNRRRPKITFRSGQQPPADMTRPSLAARVAALSRRVRALALEAVRTGSPVSTPTRVSVAEIGGRALWAPGTDWKRACYYMLSAGLDPGLARFLRGNIPPGADFVDIGAGLGAYTLLAASLVNDGFTHAFEADPETYRWLTSNLSGAGDRIRTYPLLLETVASVMREIAVSGRSVATVRIGGDTPLLSALRSIEVASREHPQCRVVIEYCAALHGHGTAGVLVDEAAALGLTTRRISSATGEVEDLRREDLESAFSIHLLLDRPQEARWSR